jgi:hypothetical protein
MVEAGSAGNRITARLQLTIGNHGEITTDVSGAPAELASCIRREFAGMHDDSGARSITTTMTFTNR